MMKGTACRPNSAGEYKLFLLKYKQEDLVKPPKKWSFLCGRFHRGRRWGWLQVILFIRGKNCAGECKHFLIKDVWEEL